MSDEEMIVIINHDGVYIDYAEEEKGYAEEVKLKPMSVWARFQQWFRGFIDGISRALRRSNKVAPETIEEEEAEEAVIFDGLYYGEMQPSETLEKDIRYKLQYKLYCRSGKKAQRELLGVWEHTFSSDTDYYKDGHPALKWIDDAPSPDENLNAEPSADRTRLRMSPEVLENVIKYFHYELDRDSLLTRPAESSKRPDYPIESIKSAEILHFAVMASGVMEGNDVKQLNKVIEIYNKIYSRYNNLVERESKRRSENKDPSDQYIGEDQEKHFTKAQAIHSDLKCMLEDTKTKIPAAQHVSLTKLIDISPFIPYEDWLNHGMQELPEIDTEELPGWRDTWDDEFWEDSKTLETIPEEDEIKEDVDDVLPSSNIEEARSALVKEFYALNNVSSFGKNILEENIRELQLISLSHEALKGYNKILEKFVEKEISQESIEEFISIAQNFCMHAQNPKVFTEEKETGLIGKVCNILTLECLADLCLELNNQSEIDHVYNKYYRFAEAAELKDDKIQKAELVRDACKEVIAFRQQEFKELSALHSRYKEVREKTSAISGKDCGSDSIWRPYLDGLSMALTRLESMNKQITPQDPCLTKFMHDSDAADKTGHGFMKWMFGVESIDDIKKDCPGDEVAVSINEIVEALDKVIQTLSEEQSRGVTSV